MPISDLFDPRYAAWLQGIGSLLTGLGVGAAVLQWRLNQEAAARSRRLESIKKITELYERFYQIDKITTEERIDFEYNFSTIYAPVMERWLRDRDALGVHDCRTLAKVDALLNFFEHVAHLSSSANELLLPADREAAFDFWFTVMRRDSHVVLRRYLLHSFEHIQSITKFPRGPVYLAVYGTLMSGEFEKIEGHDRLKQLMRDAKPLGRCSAVGQMYEHKRDGGVRFPYLCLDNRKGQIVAQLFQIGNDDEEASRVLDVLDAYENDPVPGAGPQPSYIARYVMVNWEPPGGPEQKIGAWIYAADRHISGDAPIPSGNWKAYTGA